MRRLQDGNPNTQAYWNDTILQKKSLEINYAYTPAASFVDLLFRMTEFVLNSMPAGYVPTFLDVGSGSGMILKRFVGRYGLRIRFSTCDFSRPSLEWVKEKMPLLEECFLCDARARIEKPDKSYDIVMATEVIEHMDDPKAFVDELARLSRRLILISCPFEERSILSTFHVWAFSFADIHGFLAAHGNVEINADRGCDHFIAACRLDGGEYR